MQRKQIIHPLASRQDMLQSENLMPNPRAKLPMELLDDHTLQGHETLRHHYQLRRPRGLGLAPGIDSQTMAELWGKRDNTTTLLVLVLGMREGCAGSAERPRSGRK